MRKKNITNTKPAKRKYTKRTFGNDMSFSKQMADSIELVQEDNEVEELRLICRMIDSWGPEQKERNLNYIFSKYKKLL
jgi:hypothetical protein